MKSASHHRGVITLAYGADRYTEQARSLAHSLQLHAPHLPRTLVTDSDNEEIRSLFTEVIPYRKEFGSGIQQKMFLDQYSPYEQTLFIDSDCLVLGNLEEFWAAFGDQCFGVPGYRYLQQGCTDPYLDVDHVLAYLHLDRIPKFNGGTYYFNRSPEAAQFFATARKFWEDSRTLKLREFRREGGFRRDGLNDEAVYAVAMAVHKIGLTPMGPRGMWTPLGYKGPLLLDAVRGKCSFEKEGMKLSPEIIHFPGEYAYAFAYARERARLRERIERKKTSMLSLAASFATSALWQCSRRSSGLSALAKKSVRALRATRSMSNRLES